MSVVDADVRALWPRAGGERANLVRVLQDKALFVPRGHLIFLKNQPAACGADRIASGSCIPLMLHHQGTGGTATVLGGTARCASQRKATQPHVPCVVVTPSNSRVRLALRAGRLCCVSVVGPGHVHFVRSGHGALPHAST